MTGAAWRSAQLSLDLATLTALAHTGWLSTSQLHALCFPNASINTVRSTLKHLAQTGCVAPIRWRCSVPDGGQPWFITPLGIEVLTRYRAVQQTIVIHDVQRPGSALQQVEWQTQLAVRDVIVQMVMTARATPWLAALETQLPPWPPTWPAPLAADAKLAIVWDEAEQQSSHWLPWPYLPDQRRVHEYWLFLAREEHTSALHRLAAVPLTPATVPLLLVREPAQLQAVADELRVLAERSNARSRLLVADWTTLTTGFETATWRDANGTERRLRPDITDVASLTDVASRRGAGTGEVMEQ